MFWIKKININNFRSIENRSFLFDKHINLLYGPNGVGKTSIIEAVGYTCLGKSLKKAKDKDVLKFDKPYFNIITLLNNGNDDEKAIIYYDGVAKKIKKGEETFKSLSDYVGKYKIVSFIPDDLDIVKGTPGDRRRFLDTYISQMYPIYLKDCINYKKILKSKNDFLKNFNNTSKEKIMLDVLNQKLASLAKQIIIQRKKYINELNCVVENISNKLTKFKELVKICYDFDIDDVNIEKTFQENLKFDIIAKCSTCGPQKDDIRILINEKNSAIYSSQGQIRTAVLALKLAIIDIFSKINDNIIIVLDDVFSELDLERQKDLINLVENRYQTFITCSDLKKIDEKILQKCNIIEITEGE